MDIPKGRLAPSNSKRIPRKSSLIEVRVTAKKLKWDFEALSNGGHIDQIAFYLLSFSIES